MITIVMLNEKGGVGKTTLAATIGAILAYYGFRTLVIDTDTQGHATLRLGLKREDGFFDLIANNQQWQVVIKALNPEYYGGDTEDSRLFVVPGWSANRKLENDLNAAHLIRRLQEIKNAFDFVIVDTSPKIGRVHTAFFVASDYIIIPTECTRLSVEGVVSTISHIQQIRQEVKNTPYNVAALLGIIPTRFNGNKKLHYQNLGWLGGKYGDDISMFSPIRFLTDWEKAEALSIPIHMYKRKRGAAQEALALVSDLLERIGVVTHA